MKKFKQADIQLKDRPKELQYTNEDMAKLFISLVPSKKGDSWLDPSAGPTKVFYCNFPTKNKDYCEIEEGKDFLMYNTPTDWIIGNPPFRNVWQFFEKSSLLARKGFGFLVNLNRLNLLTPKRFETIKNNGFYLNNLWVVSDKRWFGRYYFLLFTRKTNRTLGWETKSF